METIKLIEKFEPCKEAINWLQDKTVEEAFNTCERGDWLLWLYRRSQDLSLEENLRRLTLAKAKIAETVKHLMKDERSIKAVEVALLFGEGKATREELDAAADAAYSAAYAAAYAAAAAAAAYSKTKATKLKEYADIVREVLPLEVWKF